MMTIKDYILCYSPAYLFGVAHGLILAIVLRHVPDKTTQWRRNHGK
jgi:hypothetical protein